MIKVREIYFDKAVSEYLPIFILEDGTKMMPLVAPQPFPTIWGTKEDQEKVTAMYVEAKKEIAEYINKPWYKFW